MINIQLLPIMYTEMYIIQQTGNENTQTYQGEVVIWILHHILATNLQGIVHQPT